MFPVILYVRNLKILGILGLVSVLSNSLGADLIENSELTSLERVHRSWCNRLVSNCERCRGFWLFKRCSDQGFRDWGDFGMCLWGRTSRERRCADGCGRQVESKSCNVFDPWTTWSTCDPNCEGQSTRTRRCRTRCTRTHKESLDCKLNGCRPRYVTLTQPGLTLDSAYQACRELPPGPGGKRYYVVRLKTRQESRALNGIVKRSGAPIKTGFRERSWFFIGAKRHNGYVLNLNENGTPVRGEHVCGGCTITNPNNNPCLAIGIGGVYDYSAVTFFPCNRPLDGTICERDL